MSSKEENEGQTPQKQPKRGALQGTKCSSFRESFGIRLESAINPVLAVSWLELEVFSRNHQGFKSTNHQFKSLRGKLVLLQGFIQAFVRMKIAT